MWKTTGKTKLSIKDVQPKEGDNMRLKATLGGIAAILAVGVFYTFALCMVEDVDASSISAEYYYEEETAGNFDSDSAGSSEETISESTGASSASADREYLPQTKKPVKPLETETESSDENDSTDIASAAVSEKNYAGGNTGGSLSGEKNSEAETENDSQTEISETASAEKEENDVSDYVYGEDESEELPDEDLDEIEDTNDLDAAFSDTETEAETEFITDTEFQPFADDDADFLALFTSITETEETTADTAVSVDVPAGGDISTSETFTAKFNGSTHTVNAYDLICQIVNNEMSTSFSDEAIKAQAVAAYSYMKYHNVNGLTPSVLVKKNPPDRIKNLVSEVWGVCCYYNGSVAQTVYMASSSGYTADAKNVWGGNVPYLKSVYCPFDVGEDPNYGSTLRVSENSMRSMLENSLGISLSNNPYNWLVILNYIDGNYVHEISIDGQKTISGKKLRETVMGHKLKSAAFDVRYSDGEFIFTTYGYGHGVGMSQNGANILAKQGWSYYDILTFYFTGIEVI